MLQNQEEGFFDPLITRIPNYSYLDLTAIWEASRHLQHSSIAPRLLVDPATGVKAIRAFAQVRGEFPLGVVRSPAVLEEDHVAVTDIDPGDLGSSLWLGIVRCEVSKAGYIPSVGCALHDDGKPAGYGLAVACGTVYIRREMHTIAGRLSVDGASGL